MKRTHAIVFGLIASLVFVAILSLRSQEQIEWIADNGMLLIMAIGFIGLVSAREKTPDRM